MRAPPSPSRTSLAVVTACAAWTTGCGPTAPPRPKVTDQPVVVVADFAFKPGTVAVRAGQVLTWRFSQPEAPHNVVSLAGPETVDSGAPQGSGSFSYTFTVTGTTTYWCRVHPFMRGKVLVTP